MKRFSSLVLSLVAAASLAQTPAPAPTTPAAPASSDGQPAATTTATPNGQPAPANNPLAKAVQARTPEEQANQSGIQLITTLDHYLGMGTFVDARYYSSLTGWLTIIPQYLFGIGKQRLVASATIRLVYEYTLPDVETGRRFSWWDLAVGVSAPAFFRDTALTGIAFTPSLGLTIPSTIESINAGLIGTLRGGITASRSIKVFDFRANVSGSASVFGQPVNGYRNPTLNGGQLPTDGNGNLLLVCRPGEQLCGVSNNNTAFTISAGGQVQWRATGSLLFYVGYTYIRAWRYSANTVKDEFTPKALDSNGNPVSRVGMGSFDRTSAFFGGSYQLNEHYSLDLGVSNVQTPLTPTGQVRFPFLSFGTWADNATSIYFTLTAAY
ncbi:MAG: hypothetical protein JNM17_06350 [Archangium sp.]|nr:hypothetical protein [Archangium sp.]